jgi:hypothetical protein
MKEGYDVIAGGTGREYSRIKVVKNEGMGKADNQSIMSGLKKHTSQTVIIGRYFAST